MKSAVAGVCLLSVALTARAADDPLAAMRQAMGGDAALSAIKTLGLQGSSSSKQGGGPLALEVRVELPDRFVSISRQFFVGPFGQQTLATAHGYAGGDLIGYVDSTLGAELPPFPELLAARTPEQLAALTRRQYEQQRRRMLAWTIPLLGGANSDPGFTLGDTRDDVLAGKPVKVVDLITRWDGSVMRLTIDAATRLPAKLSWMDRPDEGWLMSVSSEVSIGPRGRTETPASTPPTITGRSAEGRPDVEYATLFDQFKTDQGLTWPRRFTHTIDGKVTGDTKVSKISINPKFPKDAFRLK